MVIARLITPAQFGVVAIATTIYTGLLLFRDMGLGAILISDRTVTPRMRASIFALYTLLAPLLSVTLLAIGLVCMLTGQSELSTAIFVLAIQAFFSAFTWYLWPAIQHAQRFDIQFWTQAVQGIVSALGSILLAASGWGVAGVMVGQLLGVLLASIYQVVSSKLLPFPRYSSSDMRYVLRRGRGFFAQSGLAYLSQSADNYITGLAIGSAAVGTYNAAYRLAELPYSAIANPVFQVTFVRLSAKNNSGQDIRADFVRSLRTIVFLTLPASAAFVAMPTAIVAVLLGDQWAHAVPVLSILGFWSIVRTIQSCYGWLLNSIGRAGAMAKVALITLAFEIPALIAGAILFGTIGVAVAMVADMAVSLGCLVLLCSRELGADTANFLKHIFRFLTAASLAAVVGWTVLHFFTGLGVVGSFLLGGAVIVVVYAACCAILERTFLCAAIRRLRLLAFRWGVSGS